MLKSARPGGGYTILEATIAITLIMGGMVLGMVVINSRLKQENFYKGVSRFSVVVDDILNDVGTNNWPHVEGWECQLAGGGIDFNQVPGHQPGEGDCLYVGKVIQFGDERTVTEDDGSYIIHTIMTHKNALIPIYSFDNDIAPRASRPGTPGGGNQPLATLEKAGSPGFSARETRSFPNGIQVNQIYYLATPGNPADRVYLRGLAIVQVSAHGLKENDLLLQSGAGHIGIRVVRDSGTIGFPPTPAGAGDPNATRPTADAFAGSLQRIRPGTNAGSEFDDQFNLPIYICLSDGRGNQALGILGGRFGGLLVTTEFDESEIALRC